MRPLANEQLEVRAIKEDNAVPEKVGTNWQYGFRGRFPNIQVERTKVMERMRVTGASRTVLDDYLDLFKQVVCSMVAENVYNMDETGIQLGVDMVEACALLTKLSIIVYASLLMTGNQRRSWIAYQLLVVI
jgi:hypothetical protein